MVMSTFICPLCKNNSKHDSTHPFEVFTTCNVCGNSILYNAEYDFNDVESIKAKFRYYRYELLVPKDLKEYSSLYLTLSKTRTLMKVKPTKLMYGLHFYWQRYSDSEIDIYQTIEGTKSHKTQYVTSIGRLFNWYEHRTVNVHLRIGYWLDFSNEVIEDAHT